MQSKPCWRFEINKTTAILVTLFVAAGAMVGGYFTHQLSRTPQELTASTNVHGVVLPPISGNASANAGMASKIPQEIPAIIDFSFVITVLFSD